MKRSMAMMPAAIVLVLPINASAAGAQDMSREIVRCSVIVDNSSRLACFDKLVPNARKTDAELRAEAQAKAAREFGLAESRRPKEKASEGARLTSAEALGENSQVTAKIQSVSIGQVAEVLALDNGQVWQTTSVGSLTTVPRAGQGVVIRSGPLGGYRLVFEGKSREVAVKRIR